MYGIEHVLTTLAGISIGLATASIFQKELERLAEKVVDKWMG
jgi:hypothetical protein